MSEPHDPNRTVDEPSAPADSLDAGLAAGFAKPAGPQDTIDHVAGAGSTDESHPNATTPAGNLPEMPGYQVLREIARGGMGRVLAARDLNLDRDVALKILLPGANADRFVRESKITARLPHPGIPPVHALGTLADGSPFLAMKLIAGQTLAQEMKSADRPRLLQVFAQICQAVGFAHSRGVIHRDLKPANIMVGAFGEVQVMDWGLAKTIGSRSEGVGSREESSAPESCQEYDDSSPHSPLPTPYSSSQTQVGQIMGTPAYMAPEQARGEATDARGDVFALGGILCAILTGVAPYSGKSTLDVIRRAGAADLTEANARLDGCGADAELIALCRHCLSPSLVDRPADGQAVADGMTAYLDGVQEKLRKAELAETEARTKALEEAKRWRLRMALAMTVLLAVMLGGGGLLWWKTDRNARQAQVTRDVNAALNKAEVFVARGQFTQAREQTQRALALLEGGPADEDLRKQVRDMQAGLAAEKKDRILVAALDEAWLEQAENVVGQNRYAYERALPKFRKAFSAYGMPVGEGEPADVAVRIRKRPPAVREAIIAALDEWDNRAGQEKLGITEPHREWLRKVLAAVELEDSWSRQLRAARAEKNSAKKNAALERLAASADVAKLPPQALARLAASLRPAQAVKLLRRTRQQYPADFWVNFNLGIILQQLMPPKNDEAVRFLAAAEALRPRSAGTQSSLGNALGRKGRWDEAIDCFHKAIALDPTLASAHNGLGGALDGKGRLDEAIASVRKAIKLDAKNAVYRANLASVLMAKGQWDEAVAYSRKAIKIDPELAAGHDALGLALLAKGQVDEAIASLRQAIKLAPKDAKAHNNLGKALVRNEQLAKAIASYKKAIALALTPNDAAAAYNNLGGIYCDNKRDFDTAITLFEKAIALDPKLAEAQYGLGNVFMRKRQLETAIACYEKAIALNPKFANARRNLAIIHIHYANGHSDNREWDKAIARIRKAIGVDPNFAAAHATLGQALLNKGSYAEARDASAHALKLFPDGHPLRARVSLQLQECERLVKLEGRLPQFLKGAEKPGSAQENLQVSQMCRNKRLNAAAARFAAAAFADEPRLADDLRTGQRYNAACWAALAAAGQGEDAGKLDGKEKTRLRRQALDWLRADLAIYTKLQDSGRPGARPFVQKQMYHWQKDNDLAGIRDEAVLAELPAQERAAFTKLWADVATLLKKAERVQGKQIDGVHSVGKGLKLRGHLDAQNRALIHQVKLAAGKAYVIEMTSRQFDTYLRLEDDQKKVLAENDDINARANNLNARIVLTPKQDGVYRIIATSFEQRGLGEYTLVIREFRK